MARPHQRGGRSEIPGLLHPEFARIASPLHHFARKETRFEWSEACQELFDSLKRALVVALMLPYPDPASPYLLDTDASTEGLGAVL